MNQITQPDPIYWFATYLILFSLIVFVFAVVASMFRKSKPDIKQCDMCGKVIDYNSWLSESELYYREQGPYCRDCKEFMVDKFETPWPKDFGLSVANNPDLYIMENGRLVLDTSHSEFSDPSK